MAKGMIFFEDYFNYMDDMTPEQFYQFMGLIRDLRYNGVDKDANEIEDKVVRLAWRSVRHSVGKSKKNAEDYDKRKKKEQEAQPKQREEPSNDELLALRNWYGILSTKDNDRYFNSSWNQFFDDYETAKIAANNYLIEELKTHKSWLM